MSMPSMRAAMLAVAMLSSNAHADLMGDARAAYTQAQWRQAADLYKELVQQDPSLDNLWHLGRAQIGNGQAADAEATLQRALTQDPNDLRSLFYMAVALTRTGDRDGAFAYLDRGVKAGLPMQSVDAFPDLSVLHDDARYAALAAEADRLQHPCPTDPAYRAFDFWVGDWDVYTPDGVRSNTSHNLITLELHGCLVHERWSGGGFGESFNYYNAHTRHWHQNYVDESGSTVWYEGASTAPGVMHMEGGYANQDGSTGLARVTWTKMPDGSVHHFIERSTDGGRTWSVYFDAYYRAAKAR
jgi:tetratricopeptide (TPR) repeat protein